MKSKLTLVFLLISSVFVLNGCRTDNPFPDKEPHVNSIPKKISVYEIDTLTSAERLLKSYSIYYSDNKNYPDSVRVNDYHYADEYSYLVLIRDTLFTEPRIGVYDRRGLYVYFLNAATDSVYYPIAELFFDADNNLAQIFNEPFNCDGGYSYSYSFLYNLDGSLRNFSKGLTYTRCSGYGDYADLEYKNDTVFYTFGPDYVCNSIDTVTFYNDNEHLSTIPLFYIPRCGELSLCGGGTFFSYTLFLKYSSKKYPLIKQIRNNFFGETFLVDYSYSFNSNNDVSQMIIDARVINYDFTDINKRLKYKFEY